MAFMNRCYREAKNLLNSSEDINSEDLKHFIDKFNIKIENYSFNGLSSYLLSCVELSLQLAGVIGYTKGEVVTRWLKGHALFLGGYYSLADKSFKTALMLAENHNILYGALSSSYALNKAYIGDFEESLNIIEKLVLKGDVEWSRLTLSSILKFKQNKDMAYRVLEPQNKKEDSIGYDAFCKVSRLLDLNNMEEAKESLALINNVILEDNEFYSGYRESIHQLISARNGSLITDDNIENILKKLNFKYSFYHYIDGLLNISEIYLISNELEKCTHLLEIIISEKKELVLLDNRLYSLLSKCYKLLGDNELYSKYSKILENLTLCCSSPEIEEKINWLLVESPLFTTLGH